MKTIRSSRVRLSVSILVAGSGFAASTATAALPAYHVQDLGTLGGRTTTAADINNLGQVTGYSERADGELRAFLYANAQLQDLGALAGRGSLGNALNDSGQVTGFAVGLSGRTQAVIFDHGSITELPALRGAVIGNDINRTGDVVGQRVADDGISRAFARVSGVNRDLSAAAGFDSFGVAINDAGQVLGTYFDAAGSHAFVFDQGRRRDVMPGRTSSIYGKSAFNELGQVTGSYEVNGVTRAFLFDKGRVIDLSGLGGDYSFGFGISAKGDVTGVSARADGQRHAFVYSAGRTTDLGTLGGTVSFGYAINSSRQVAGESMLGNGGYHAFVHSQGKMTDLGAALEKIQRASYLESVAFGINEAGQVIGRYSAADPSRPGQFVFRSFLATPLTTLFADLAKQVVGVGSGKSLANKLAEASRAYAASNATLTCSSLKGFRSELAAQSGKKIARMLVTHLQQDSTRLEVAIGCPRS